MWDNGGVRDAGAVTWGDGSRGISGVVTQSNSLVGSQTDDEVGSNGVVALTNGNYVVSSSFWDNGGESNAGAVTWGDGSRGISGAVIQSNSLVGSTADDFVGISASFNDFFKDGAVALTNGNYVVRSPYWDNGGVSDAGAVTWGDGTTGETIDGNHTITPQNSLIGRTADADLDEVVEDPVNGTVLVSFVGEGSGRVTVIPIAPDGSGEYDYCRR
ncbi:MAG: hypothetical protein RH949_16255 [Coleofasciculus sp. A1-SPW-01]|uniref:hypothetical protein n=1 Tax=Coleofasciculus sp. A1-SPW-01 TaxID=3070819 RepID=UPI0032F866E1